MPATIETHPFQAETRLLLNLMIHSLYTHKEIFLRELVSNASDALDRLRFEALTRSELLEADETLGIRIQADPKERTLTIHDNGIGMSREEVIEHIGTIAKSGTRELMDRIREEPGSKAAAELIGQFGVGFYSSFMVAAEVSLLTRRAGEEQAWLWHSRGDGTYTVAEAEKAGRGTSITLHLKAENKEDGLEDFTDDWVISRIVKRYSDFVTYPVVLETRAKPVDDGGQPAEGETEAVREDRTLNSMKPLWAREKHEVPEEELYRLYRHLSNDWTEPAETIWLKAEGRVEYRGLLFIPKKAPHDLFYFASKPGLQLYVRKVLIMESCEALLPRYLRFVKGVVDSPDLPLNISRETLQQDRQITQIRRFVTRKVLDTLAELQAKAPETYVELWTELGRALKEGVGEDFDNRDRLLPLLLFQSSADPQTLTTLGEYVGRMKEGQERIYYLTGESRAQVESSPLLEAYAQKGYEILFMVDPVDELLMQSLTEHDGKRFKSVGKGGADLGSKEEREQAEEALKEREVAHKDLLEAIQKRLDAHVKQVRLTNRLTQSPVCLVGAEHDYSPQLERLLQKGKGGGALQRRILELNPDHPIVARLKERFDQDADDTKLQDSADLLFGYGLLAEGSQLTDPAHFNRLVADLLAETL